MYAASKIIPITGKIKPNQEIVTTFAVLLCCAVFIVLVISTIVIALIPIYLPKKSITVNPNVSKTKEITMSIEVEQNHEVDQIRKKRDEGDLYYLVNGTLGQEGLDMIKKTCLSVLSQAHFVKDVIISNASLAYDNQRRKRHSILSKRQVYPKRRILLIIKFYIIFTSHCLYACQSYNSPILQELLFTIETYEIVYVNVPIYKNGVFFMFAPRIEYMAIVYISIILPGMSPSVEGSLSETIGLTMTTTDSTTSPSITAISGD